MFRPPPVRHPSELAAENAKRGGRSVQRGSSEYLSKVPDQTTSCPGSNYWPGASVGLLAPRAGGERERGDSTTAIGACWNKNSRLEAAGRLSARQSGHLNGRLPQLPVVKRSECRAAGLGTEETDLDPNSSPESGHRDSDSRKQPVVTECCRPFPAIRPREISTAACRQQAHVPPVDRRNGYRPLTKSEGRPTPPLTKFKGLAPVMQLTACGAGRTNLPSQARLAAWHRFLARERVSASRHVHSRN